jgi:ADP-ribosylation factor GTPase-activating protein 1
MSMYAPFPESVLREIRLLYGNHKCCDCSSHDTDWANINHGTLICLECAGKHRSLGVHISFIRSLYMDTWNENQV